MTVNGQASNLLDNLLQELIKHRRNDQAIIAVEAPNQSFRWTGSSGKTASGEPVLESTPFFIASIDKLYNATITMMLAGNGKLELDQSICHYLPETITRGLHRDGGHDLTEQITMRHLLTHTSGLPDWFEDYPKGGTSLAETVFKEGDRMLPIAELTGHVRDKLRPHFPPQDLSKKRPAIRYSDTNFILVAEIIESVTGMPLHEVHQKMLYEPFELNQTFFFNQSRPLKPVSSSMELRVNGEPLHIPLLLQSIKAIYSTAADMMKFIMLLMSNKLFSNPETLSAMTSHWHRFGFPMDRAALRSPNWPIEYATGIMRFSVPRIFTPFNPIPTVLGHTGSTGCWLFYCPQLEVAMAGSVEDATAGAVPFGIVPQILRTLSQSGWQHHT